MREEGREEGRKTHLVWLCLIVVVYRFQPCSSISQLSNRAAPEMLWGERCSEKADIYSYGAAAGMRGTAWVLCIYGLTRCLQAQPIPTPLLHLLAGIVLWEMCTGEKPVRGQLRDVVCVGVAARQLLGAACSPGAWMVWRPGGDNSCLVRCLPTPSPPAHAPTPRPSSLLSSLPGSRASAPRASAP